MFPVSIKQTRRTLTKLWTESIFGCHNLRLNYQSHLVTAKPACYAYPVYPSV